MATPFKMKNSALYKSAKHGSPMQNNFTSKVKKAAKAIYEATVPPGLQKVNEKIVNKLKGDKSKTKSEVVDFSKKDSNYKVQFTKSEPKAKLTKTKTKTKTDERRIWASPYLPPKGAVKMPVVNNDTRPPKKTSMATMKKSAPTRNYKKGYYGA